MRFLLITIVFCVIALFAGVVTLNTFKDEPVAVKAEPNESGYCFQEFLPYGEHMSWKETSEGHYDYEIYANTHGIEVWVPCN